MKIRYLGIMLCLGTPFIGADWSSWFGYPVVTKDTNVPLLEETAPKRAFEDAKSYKEKIDAFFNESGRSITALKQRALTAPEREQLQEFKTNLKGLIPFLERAREDVMVLLARTSQDFIEDMDQTVKKNLEGTGLRAEDVYPYLYGPDQKEPSLFSHKEVRGHIAEKLSEATNDLDKKRLRQIGYLLRTAAGKEQFDAYLAGKDALARLIRTDKEQIDVLWEGMLNLKSDFSEYLKNIEKLLTQ